MSKNDLTGFKYQYTCDYDLTSRKGNKGTITSHTYATNYKYLIAHMEHWNRLGGDYYTYYLTEEDVRANNKQRDHVDVPYGKSVLIGEQQHSQAVNV